MMVATIAAPFIPTLLILSPTLHHVCALSSMKWTLEGRRLTSSHLHRVSWSTIYFVLLHTSKGMLELLRILFRFFSTIFFPQYHIPPDLWLDNSALWCRIPCDSALTNSPPSFQRELIYFLRIQVLIKTRVLVLISISSVYERLRMLVLA